MTILILVDGDNIQIEAYLQHVKPSIEEKWGTDYKLIFYCQSNLIFKYKPMRFENLTIVCSHTSGKNASDARILFDLGRFIAEDQYTKYIVVSNDKIYQEVVDNEKVFMIGYNTTKHKKLKVNKENLINVYKNFLENANQSDDLYLEDFRNFFKCESSHEFKNHINNVPQLKISCNDVIYWNKDNL